MSDTTTVRISSRTRDRLRELAGLRGAAMSQVLDEAVEAFRRQLFLRSLNEAYREVRQDERAWAEVQEERADWDSTLADGLGGE